MFFLLLFLFLPLLLSFLVFLVIHVFLVIRVFLFFPLFLPFLCFPLLSFPSLQQWPFHHVSYEHQSTRFSREEWGTKLHTFQWIIT
jgi:hypothetical protein